jgi:ribosomal protein S18 acetylase RimI-like enzyme
MVVTAATQTSPTVRGGLRPLDPVRDLRSIANLIAEAFSDEMDARGQAALREMRWMARLWPFVWWWAQTDPSFRDAFNGFVWEEPSIKGERSQIVGNVSLNRAPGNRQRWIICNVVVQEELRGRGIGRSLTEAAIVEAQELGAAGVVLQVYQNNLLALQLYTDLGFQEVTGETDLRLEAVTSVAFLDAPGYSFRPWRPADGQAAYELARLVTPSALQWLTPIRTKQYRLDPWTRLEQWLGDLVAARRTYRLVVLKEDRLVAMMTIAAAFRRGDHHLTLLVHPDHTGRVEAALVSRALHMLAASPVRPIRATVDMQHAATLKVLCDYGFEEKRTLLTLCRDFR